MAHTRTFRGGAAAIAAVALLVGWLVPFGHASAGDTQVQVFDPEGKFSKFIDNGKPDFSPGDQIIEIHTLLDPADGSDAGKILTEVTVLRVVPGGDDFDLTVHCTVVLPEGTIVFYGGFRFSDAGAPSGVTLPITGGTGDFELVRGTVNIALGELDGAPGATLTFDLTTT
jgi:hypothetical protein